MCRTSGNLLLIVMYVFVITGCGSAATAKKESAITQSDPKPSLAAKSPDKSPATSEKMVVSQAPEPASAGDAPPMAAIKSLTAPVAPAPPVSIPAPATPIIKKGSNHFVITVAEKTLAHPNFGKGHHLGFVLDNVPGKTVVLKRGETYEFNVQTDPLHDVYFSTNSLGSGGGTVTEGIKGQFTYRGLIVVSPTEKTPDIAFYQCRNHNSMGGKVVIVNKTASMAEINRRVAESATTSVAGVVVADNSKINANDAAKQKIMLAELMLQSKAAKMIADNGSEGAKNSLSNATTQMQTARQELSSGHASQALILAENALRLVTLATQSISSEEAAKLQRIRYKEALDALRNFQDSHKQSFDRTVKKRGAAAAIDYDHAKVDGLVSDARTLHDKGEHEKATQALIMAERLVTQAIQLMLNAQTIVYDLNFETPADEYEYERKRFIGYEELIPIAIEEKKPAEAMVKLMDTYVVKGRARKSEAEGKAKAGSYPEAISLMLSGTEEIQRALRLAGVSQ